MPIIGPTILDKFHACAWSKMLYPLVLFLLLTIAGCQSQEDSSITILPAHAHNDYEHPRPLLDALSHSFKSVEADVFAIGDSLFVAHDFEDIATGRTLCQLYLDPLRHIIKANNGSVYGNGEELILLVDIKSSGLETYMLLNELLSKYQDIVSYFENGQMIQQAVLVVVSGNRPIEYMQQQTFRRAGFDGRLEDLNSGISQNLMPMVSDNWNKHFDWNGIGTMPDNEKVKLHEISKNAIDQGYILRFWATPNATPNQRTAIWTELKEAGVGLIGVDELEELHSFYLK